MDMDIDPEPVGGARNPRANRNISSTNRTSSSSSQDSAGPSRSVVPQQRSQQRGARPVQTQQSVVRPGPRPSNAVYNSMTDESLVNGVWFHVLSQAFPMPKYILAPEYRLIPNGKGAPGLRSDLYVIRIDGDGTDQSKNKRVFAFEGKKKGSSFAKAQEQLAQYAKSGNTGNGSDYSFGAVAVGSQYAIIQYNSGGIKRRRHTFEEVNQMITAGVVPAATERGQVYDTLSCQVDYERVLEMLKSIERWISEKKK